MFELGAMKQSVFLGIYFFKPQKFLTELKMRNKKNNIHIHYLVYTCSSLQMNKKITLIYFDDRIMLWIELLNVRLSKLSKLNWAQQIIFSQLSLFNASFFNISFHFTTSKSKESEKQRKEEKDIPTKASLISGHQTKRCEGSFSRH